MKDYIAIANQYIDDVLSGRIAACQWVIRACERQRDDLLREEFEYYFDEQAAIRVCYFIELLKHIKGKWAGKPIVLEPWQVFILTTLFGWLDEDGNRRFKTAYIEVPRKNAKSTLSSGIALYCLAADGEGGAEVYSAATTRDQARIVFQDAKRMAERCEGLRRRFGVETSAHAIYVESTASTFKALSRDQGGNLDGLNVHMSVIDELHAHKTRDVWDVIETATGARTSPLLLGITTAGFNRSGICYEQRTYVTKILNKVFEDEEYFGIVYSIDDDDDWTDPEVWIKANPNWGVSVKPEDIKRKARKAMQMSSAQNNFLTKHLNCWVNADTAWMDMRAWDRCADPDLCVADFEGEEVIGAVDLSSKKDMTGKIKLFRRYIDDVEHYYCFGDYYLPEAAIENEKNSQYEGWEIDGLLTATPGIMVDYSYIEDDLLEDAEKYDLLECCYDPFQATQFCTRMLEEGIEMVEIKQTANNLSEPMKELEALVLDGRFHHNGCPIMTWMISNVVARQRDNGQMVPKKELEESKIDGVVCILMALGRYITEEGDDPPLNASDIICGIK